MATVTGVSIDQFGQILLPLEANRELNLHNDDWLKVSIKSDHIVIAPQTRDTIDKNLIEALIHEGIVMDLDK